MLSRRRPLSRLTASVAAAALSFGLLAATPGLAEAGMLEDKTTFLGLEGEGELVTALSDAIRWDLNQRGRDDGNTMSLAELKLTMGCGDNDMSCLAQGGQTLGSSELIYGTMSRSGSTWTVTLRSLDVESGELGNEIQRQLSDEELAEAALGKTAASLIDELYKIEPTPEELPPAEDITISEGEAEGEAEPELEPEEPKPTGALIWGPYKPRPGWKLAGVGISGGLTVAALGAAIGTTIAISENGPIRQELLDTAQASLDDDKPSNDVDPNTSGDLCRIAQTPPDPNKPDEVTNAEVTRVCIKADNVATAATASWVATGVFALSTVVFTTLLFVHKEEGKVAAKLIEHDVGLGGAPLQGGGFMLGGSLRF